VTSEAQSAEKDQPAIVAELLRLGFLSGAEDSEQEAIVEALTTILPDGHDIAVCVRYEDFSSTQAHTFEQRTCSFLRAPRPSFGGWRDLPPSVATPRMQILLCTDQLLLWTSSKARSRGLLVEETVDAQLLPFSEILGAALAGKHGDVVHVWVDQGPTLAFHMEPASAQALQVYVDTAAS
jgi:hypothetical protein